jgi:NAD(P)H dehydrogenase (quinone)
MTKVLVLYYSSYGHIEQMADAVAEGARAGGAEVDIRRVAEAAPQAVIEAAHFKTDTAHAEIEGPAALEQYDAIIVGAPTRFGRMPAQMAQFWDTTGGQWFSGALIGKVGTDGLIHTEWSSGKPIEPDPFLKNYDWAKGLSS